MKRLLLLLVVMPLFWCAGLADNVPLNGSYLVNNLDGRQHTLTNVGRIVLGNATNPAPHGRLQFLTSGFSPTDGLWFADDVAVYRSATNTVTVGGSLTLTGTLVAAYLSGVRTLSGAAGTLDLVNGFLRDSSGTNFIDITGHRLADRTGTNWLLDLSSRSNLLQSLSVAGVSTNTVSADYANWTRDVDAHRYKLTNWTQLLTSDALLIMRGSSSILGDHMRLNLQTGQLFSNSTMVANFMTRRYYGVDGTSVLDLSSIPALTSNLLAYGFATNAVTAGALAATYPLQLTDATFSLSPASGGSVLFMSPTGWVATTTVAGLDTISGVSTNMDLGNATLSSAYGGATNTTLNWYSGQLQWSGTNSADWSLRQLYGENGDLVMDWSSLDNFSNSVVNAGFATRADVTAAASAVLPTNAPAAAPLIWNTLYKVWTSGIYPIPNSPLLGYSFTQTVDVAGQQLTNVADLVGSGLTISLTNGQVLGVGGRTNADFTSGVLYATNVPAISLANRLLLGADGTNYNWSTASSMRSSLAGIGALFGISNITMTGNMNGGHNDITALRTVYATNVWLNTLNLSSTGGVLSVGGWAFLTPAYVALDPLGRGVLDLQNHVLVDSSGLTNILDFHTMAGLQSSLQAAGVEPTNSAWVVSKLTNAVPTDTSAVSGSDISADQSVPWAGVRPGDEVTGTLQASFMGGDNSYFVLVIWSDTDAVKWRLLNISTSSRTPVDVAAGLRITVRHFNP